jgi:pyruvate dehydrogenase E1 component alpha subunit
MVAVPASDRDEPRRILDDDGLPLPGARVPSIADDALIRMFDAMLLTRIMDDRMTELVRRGRLGFYASARGEEASHLAVAPLRATDWVFPSYREQGAWFWRGYTVEHYLDQLLGNQGDPSKGRQMPAHHAASWLHLVSISTPTGTQIPHAVGAAYAARALGKDDVTLAFFGEGATSTGEFHVGLNFAGVWKAPCVFVCRNTGPITGLSSARQTAARTFAAKAMGYGMPGVRIDGNDLLAVWQAASDAIARARAGDGPTLIEAVIQDTHDGHDRRDPLHRLRGYLAHRGLWSEPAEAERSAHHHRQIDEALAAAERKPIPAVETLFDDVYEHLPWHLREQRAHLVAQPRIRDPYREG